MKIRPVITWRDFFRFSADLKSYFRSIWIGPVLITWCQDAPHDVGFSWLPD